MLDLFDGLKDVLVQPVISNRSIVTFYAGILLRLAGLYELKSDVALLRPLPEQITDILGAPARSCKA